MRVVIIVQARMGSTRLPGKSMTTVQGKPILGYIIERLQKVKHAHQIVVATTKHPLDNIIENYCKLNGIPCVRGSEHDVLDRFLQTARAYQADVVVRVCGDCPLIDPNVVDKVIQTYLQSHPHKDYVSNVVDRTYPRGMDVEVFSRVALEQAAAEAKDESDREHVTAYFLGHPDKFSLGNVAYPSNESHQRWTLDTAEDLELISLLIGEMKHGHPEFTLEDLLKVMHRHPEWENINSHVKQKPTHVHRDNK